ncbi:hypothetical protein Tco_1262891 [Tanacetum coccineum]
MEVFNGGLPRSIEGNVIALKPQTLEEAITITQRLMEQMHPASHRSLHCQVSDLQQSGSSDQGLQKLRTSISKPSLHHSTKSQDEISVRLGDYNNP